MSTQQGDLFGFRSSNQGDLFANDDSHRNDEPKMDLDVIRARLEMMYNFVKSVEVGEPHDEEAVGRYRYLYPQMSNWLPDPEREEKRAAFYAQLIRLDIEPFYIKPEHYISN